MLLSRSLILAAVLAIGIAAPGSRGTEGTLDLALWQDLLQEAVVAGEVNYNYWRDRPEFDELVQQVGQLHLEGLPRQHQLAYLINAYNILAARGILDGRSPSSLWGRYLYFKRDRYRVAGMDINLYDLEHKLLRPLAEPRIHFAIVCASRSCPVLRSEAYWPDRLNAQLEDATRGFINDPTRNRFDPDTGRASLSKIFDWFEEDFVEHAGSVQAYLADYVAIDEVAAELRQGRYSLHFLTYDWGLNGQLAGN